MDNINISRSSRPSHSNNIENSTEIMNSLSRTVRRSTSMPAISSDSKPIVKKRTKETGNSGVSIDNIYSIWNRMKKNNSASHLSLNELQTICEAVGLERNSSKMAAKKVFEALSIDVDGHISFEQFMTIVTEHFEVLQSYDQPSKPQIEAYSNMAIENINENPYDIIDRETLLNVWSEANVPHVDELLKRVIGVGYDFKCFKFSDIESAIEEEIEKEHVNNTTISLFKAALSMNRHVMSSLKKHMNDVSKENQKLYDEKKEACIKNSILAQSYDEHFESISKNKVQSMERGHSEALKKVNDRFNAERDSLISLNQELEVNMKASEDREKLLMQEIIGLKKSLQDYELENIEYHKQIEDLLDKNIDLNNKLLDSAQYTDEKISHSNEEMIELLEKIENLQLENSKLRDENDEFLSDIERLNVDLIKYKKNSKMPENLKTYKKLDIVSTNSEIPPEDPYYNNHEKDNPTNYEELPSANLLNEKLKNRVDELEKSLELLQKEYEDCENYWQSKLNDERIEFDENKDKSNRKISELLQRLTDIEEERAIARRRQLNPIDESRLLESQYEELEKEIQELKNCHEIEIKSKDDEINSLKLKTEIHQKNQSEEENHSEESISSKHSTSSKKSRKTIETSSNEELNEMKMKIEHMKQEIYHLISYKQSLIKELHLAQQNASTNVVSNSYFEIELTDFNEFYYFPGFCSS